MTRAREAMQSQGHYAGAVSRLLAYAADAFLIGSSTRPASRCCASRSRRRRRWTLNVEGLVFAVGAFLWAALYFGASWVGFARSPGMSLLGLRIVRGDGADLDRRHALIRLLAFPLGWLTLGIGFLPIVFGRTRQAIYDRVADTAVVYDWDAEAAKLRELASRRRPHGGR